jgi:hypothetical protein
MTHESVARLHGFLQQALEVELFTIPPYLTALYSIIENTNLESVQVIQSVVMEEMLHTILVSNIMNAVGATPRVVADAGGKGPVRNSFPAQVPHMDRELIVGLLPFSPAAVGAFIEIERPDVPAKDWSRSGGIETIGQLYAKLRNALVAASEEVGEDKLFSGDRKKQFEAGDYYGGGGQLAPIHCLADALAAIEVIAEQGEGRVSMTNLTGDNVRFGQPKEVAHFYRFKEICAERYYDQDDDVDLPTGPSLTVDWQAVRPIAQPGDHVALDGFATVLAAFEETYADLLEALNSAFNGDKSVLQDAVVLMQKLKVQAIDIMRIDIGGGKTCAPPFWFMRS